MGSPLLTVVVFLFEPCILILKLHYFDQQVVISDLLHPEVYAYNIVHRHRGILQLCVHLIFLLDS